MIFFNNSRATYLNKAQTTERNLKMEMKCLWLDNLLYSHIDVTYIGSIRNDSGLPNGKGKAYITNLDCNKHLSAAE